MWTKSTNTINGKKSLNFQFVIDEVFGSSIRLFVSTFMNISWRIERRISFEMFELINLTINCSKMTPCLTFRRNHHNNHNL